MEIDQEKAGTGPPDRLNYSIVYSFPMWIFSHLRNFLNQ